MISSPKMPFELVDEILPDGLIIGLVDSELVDRANRKRHQKFTPVTVAAP